MAKPVQELLTEIRDWNDTADASRELAERVEAVLRLHSTGHPDATICRGCDRVWPCKTSRALDGDGNR